MLHNRCFLVRLDDSEIATFLSVSVPEIGYQARYKQYVSLSDHPESDNTTMTKIFHPLLALIASGTDRELAKYVEFLKAMNLLFNVAADWQSQMFHRIIIKQPNYGTERTEISAHRWHAIRPTLDTLRFG